MLWQPKVLVGITTCPPNGGAKLYPVENHWYKWRVSWLPARSDLNWDPHNKQELKRMVKGRGVHECQKQYPKSQNIRNYLFSFPFDSWWIWMVIKLSCIQTFTSSLVLSRLQLGMYWNTIKYDLFYLVHLQKKSLKNWGGQNK